MLDPLLNEPVAIFLTIMTVVLVTPLLSERFRLPGIVGLILGGILVGPNGLNLLAIGDSINLLATVGLIYLMFSAGLEVNLRQFNRVREKSIVFGLFTYLVPQLMGMIFGRLLGMDWLGSILLGSAFSSHTLIAFPILTRLGIVKNESVSITVGATIFTDITAFIVLAAAIAMKGGSLEPIYFLKLFVMLIAFAGFVLFGIPRIGKAFFRRFHHVTIEFQFVLVVLFISAILAEIIGVHAVVGAFLAGLAINATLPHQSSVVNHILFLGESFFIPIFLVYSGMITDPSTFLQGWQTILIGAGMTFVAYVSKLLAAAVAARIFHYSRDEFFTVWGLSQAQAAVTIPTLIIGVQLGLFSDILFNSAIIMVLFTSITSPLIVQHYGQRLQPALDKKEERSLFDRILVPTANPGTRGYLMELAAILASSSKGILFPLNIAIEFRGKVEDIKYKKSLVKAESLDYLDTDVRLIWRVDTSPAKGIVRATIEQEISLIIMGWGGQTPDRQRVFNPIIDEVTWHTSVPVIVGRLTTSINAIQRIVLIIPQNSLFVTLFEKTIDVVFSIGQTINVPLIILSNDEYKTTLETYIKKKEIEHPYSFGALDTSPTRGIINKVNAHDLIVVTTIGTRRRFRSSLGPIAEQLVADSEASIIIIHYP